MPVYAAYASNMDPARMATRCPHSPLRGTGWLNGWRLTFAGEQHGWDGALATIVESPGSQVFVTLYDLTDEDEDQLDGWEPSIYTKIRLRVATLEGDVLAW
ncbi:MAG: gamma-glutamylcyclotransferase family protein, partial [Nocardioidaceae bacterium]